MKRFIHIMLIVVTLPILLFLISFVLKSQPGVFTDWQRVGGTTLNFAAADRLQAPHLIYAGRIALEHSDPDQVSLIFEGPPGLGYAVCTTSPPASTVSFADGSGFRLLHTTSFTSQLPPEVYVYVDYLCIVRDSIR